MKNNFCVIIHNIRSAYNVGSIIRTADGLGVDKIYITGYSPTPDSHKGVKKTALGAEKSLQWEKVWHIDRVLKNLKKEGFQLCALEQSRKSELIDEAILEFPIALVLGNEVKGVSKTILNKMDKVLEIPMAGKKESFNVSVSFGIAGYIIKTKEK